MAISNLGTKSKWVELGTSSPTSGSSVSFASLAEYASYKISYFNVDTSSSSVGFTLRINNDTGSNYAYVSLVDGGVGSSGVDTSIFLGGGASANANNHSGVVTIEDANELIKNIKFWHSGDSSAVDANNGRAFWNSESAINRIDLILTSANFTSGTIKVYGRN